jgi:hypothetical protein
MSATRCDLATPPASGISPLQDLPTSACGEGGFDATYTCARKPSPLPPPRQRLDRHPLPHPPSGANRTSTRISFPEAASAFLHHPVLLIFC